MRTRGQQEMKTPIFRDATSVDVAALARLHVTTFNETHSPIFMNGPTYEVRAYQWRQAFESANFSWIATGETGVLDQARFGIRHVLERASGPSGNEGRTPEARSARGRSRART